MAKSKLNAMQRLALIEKEKREARNNESKTSKENTESVKQRKDRLKDLGEAGAKLENQIIKDEVPAKEPLANDVSLSIAELLNKNYKTNAKAITIGLDGEYYEKLKLLKEVYGGSISNSLCAIIDVFWEEHKSQIKKDYSKKQKQLF